MAGRFTTLEYRRLKAAIEKKLAEEEENSIEWHDYKNILQKIDKIINKAEQAELKGEDEYENTRSKNKWQCDNCKKIVKIAMVKQCTVCKQSGDNISQVLLDDGEEEEIEEG